MKPYRCYTNTTFMSSLRYISLQKYSIARLKKIDNKFES